jgi:hypothetical protein
LIREFNEASPTLESPIPEPFLIVFFSFSIHQRNLPGLPECSNSLFKLVVSS